MSDKVLEGLRTKVINCPRCDSKTEHLESGSSNNLLNWGNYYCINCKCFIKIQVFA